MLKIHGLRDVHEAGFRTVDGSRGVDHVTRSILRSNGHPFRPPSTTTADAPAVAIVDTRYLGGTRWVTRWVALCGLLYDGRPCQGSETIDPEDPRLFCHGCGNEAVGGKYRLATMPTPEEREEIAELLDARPPRARAFRPDIGEDVSRLREENRRLGVRTGRRR